MPIRAGRQVDAKEVGSRLAELVAGDPGARWVFADDVAGVVELWLVTEPVTLPVAARFHSYLSALFSAFPATDIRLHVINPAQYPDGADVTRGVIPPGAHQYTVWR